IQCAIKYPAAVRTSSAPVVAGIDDAGHRDHRSRLQLFRNLFAEKFGDVEVYEIGVMENDRLDRAFDLVAFMTVGGDDVHDFARDSVLIGEGDTAEWMPNL